MEEAPRATAREVKLKRKMIVLDDDVSQLTPAEHAEILLLQAQKKVKSAIGMIKKSVDDTRCNNPLRRIHVVRGGAPIASTSTPPRSYARSAARDRNKAVMDFVDRHCSSLDMTLWGTDSAVGRMMSEAHEPPEMRRARQRAATGCSIVDTQPPAGGMRRWMESAGEGRLPWNAHSHHRAALVAELCILCKFANVGQESVHLVMQILDRVVGVWDSLLPPILMPTEGEVERASRNRPYDFDCMGAPINDMALDWRVRTVAYAVLQAVQPVRADTAVFTSTYLAKVISFFSRARTGRAGETVFPLNPSCAMSEQSDGMVYDVADIADKRDRSADDIFNNADMKVDPYTMPTVDTIAK
ncbi:hypothetical protein CAPTEDRAFT_189528, partial [Capitella teleta]